MAKPRRAFRCAAVLAALSLWAAPAAAGEDPALGGILCLPPAGNLYHGVYPGGVSGEEDDLSPADVQAYEEMAGKPAAWVYFSHNWYRSRAFPADTAAWIRDRGSTPFIRLMLRSSPEQDRPERRFSLNRILQGAFDANLRAWAMGAREFGDPLFVEFGTEVNGRWFPWNGWWNGRDRRNGYGDPDAADGPERFRDAYRHIVDLMRREGADNIVWVFHVNDQDIPGVSWNRLEQYYPGDDYVDCLGVSVYGALTPMEKAWPEFRRSMDAVYPRLSALAPSKPVLLLEFGAAANNPHGDQAEWAERALTDLVRNRWPGVAGLAWWNERWENDDHRRHDTTMRLQDSPALAAVFRKWVGAQPTVLGRMLRP